MITPFIKQEKFNIGDIVINVLPFEYDYCYIHIGHGFTVIKYDDKYDNYILKDNESDMIFDARINQITLVIDLKTAKNHYIEVNNRKKAIGFICENCPNRKISYHHRDEYDGCLLDNSSYHQSCNPLLDCIKYIEHDKIKNNKFIYDYFRNLKVKNLLK